MSVLVRSELEASPLADLHAIANQVGLDGFRRLRKAELIDAILGDSGDTELRSEGSAAERPGESAGPGESAAEGSEESAEGASENGEQKRLSGSGSRRSRSPRSRRSSTAVKDADAGDGETERGKEDADDASPSRSRRGARAGGGEGGRGESSPRRAPREASEERTGEGVVELLGNGSAFLRVDPPEPSDEDVYISAAQVRRCELVSGDRVTGPVRTPRRSERYPSLVRIDTINGASADSVSEGTRYEDLAVAYPSERLALDFEDPNLKAIEWLTPLGRGSRAVIVGAARAGKTETLRIMLGALAGREDLEVMLALVGVRPEELAEWQEGPVAPACALSFAASADTQGQALEQVIETAKRVAARGGHAVVLVDSLEGVPPHITRKALAAARNLSNGGSLTLIATVGRPFGGETTVIALDVARAGMGRLPALDLVSSGTLKPELLVGEDGAEAIAKARAAAVEG
jgi:transcription termination factor Rho